MGVSAYNRGSASISRGVCVSSGCRGCAYCSEYKPTPRPPGWGDKARLRAEKAAISLVKYFQSKGLEASIEEFTDYVSDRARVGKKTAREAVCKALSVDPK